MQPALDARLEKPYRIVSSLKRWRLLWSTLFFIALTILVTWPLVTRLDNSVIGWVGDNFFFVWLVGWFQKAFFELNRLPFSVPLLNYPQGWHLAYNEVTPVMVLIGLPASLVGGPTLGYNFSLLVSFVLSGVGVYCWVRRLTKSSIVGLIAGTIFAFSPYRMSHVLGHFNLMGTQWLPFYFMSLDDLFRTQSRRSVVLAALLLGLIGLTSQYYLYMTLILSCFYVVGHLVFVDRNSATHRGLWARLAAVGIVALPLLILSLAPYAQLAFRGELSPRSFEEVRVWSASPTDFVLPSPRHFIWGELIDRHFDRRLWIENTLYLGAVTLLFAGLAFVKRREAPNGPFIKLLVWMCVAAFVLALGTDLHWLGREVTVSVPGLIQRWHPYPRTFVPLPGYLLFKFLPFYSGMRVWMRYGVFVSLFASVLAGLGLAWLIGRLDRRRINLAACAVLALVLLDFYPGPQSLSQVEGRAVDHWLASQPGSGAVVQFPLWQITQPEQTYYTLVHNKPFVGGFYAAYSPSQFERIQPALSSFPSQESVALLRDLGVRYVLVDVDRFPDFFEQEETIRDVGLRRMAIVDNQYVYEVPVPE